jgi:predicted glycosyltransferase
LPTVCPVEGVGVPLIVVPDRDDGEEQHVRADVVEDADDVAGHLDENRSPAVFDQEGEGAALDEIGERRRLDQ